MEKKMFMKKIICGAMVGTMALSVTAVGFADDVSTKVMKTKGKQLRLEMKGEPSFHGKGGIGIFEKLVEAGIVPQEKADAMKTYMETHAQERKATFESLKGLSQEARKAYLEAHKGERADLYDQMVKSGVLSEAESTKIKTYLEENKEFGPKGKRDGKHFETVLGKLVTEGKLKETSIKTIQEYMKTQGDARKAEMEKIKDLSAEEKKAFFESNKKERVDIFEKMAEEGVISADEAKIIKEAMPQRKCAQ